MAVLLAQFGVGRWSETVVRGKGSVTDSFTGDGLAFEFSKFGTKGGPWFLR